MAEARRRHRSVIKNIADYLKFSDVGTIKFLCREKIGAGKLDEITNDEPLKLFCLLEEQQIISEGNLTWLQGVLKKIQRFDLAMKIPDEFCQRGGSPGEVDSPEMVGASPQCGGIVDSDHGISRYRMFLKTLGDEVTRKMSQK